jgi:excisionase family DNA binding protein
MLDNITFDQLPQAVANILDGIAELKNICSDIRDKDSGKDVYLTVEELCAYHPDHPSQQTVRRWKRLGIIPYYKDDETRRVRFKKSEIDAWLASSRHLTVDERNAIHDAAMREKREKFLRGDFDDDE